jgi:hypothetical protein
LRHASRLYNPETLTGGNGYGTRPMENPQIAHRDTGHRKLNLCAAEVGQITCPTLVLAGWLEPITTLADVEELAS